MYCVIVEKFFIIFLLWEVIFIGGKFVMSKYELLYKGYWEYGYYGYYFYRYML